MTTDVTGLGEFVPSPEPPEPFTCTVYGEAKPAGSKVPGMRKDGTRFVRDANPNAAEWKSHVARSVGSQHPHMMEGPIFLAIYFYVPRPKNHYGTGRNAGKVKDSAPIAPTTRPDTTKLVRGVEDALTGILWRDDAQVVGQLAVKCYGEPARVKILAQEVNDADSFAAADGSDPSIRPGVPGQVRDDTATERAERDRPVEDSG